uniref:Calponin-homology (CH) domain-containing protein n=1 Tax=Lepisosteus oculatus TaxID=7918 RepID=W5M2Y8_LEPOC
MYEPSHADLQRRAGQPPPLSPAAFVNAAQYANVLEGRFKQLQDEREAVQKKTFTKWVNSHLARVTCRIGDLYTDLRDGRMLIRLLEVLSGEQLVSAPQPPALAPAPALTSASLPLCPCP